MGQAGRRWMRCAARCRPWVGVAWWKTSRTCPVKVGDVDTDMRLICREGLTEAFLLSLEGIHRRDLDTGAKDTGAKLFATLGQPVLMHGARPAWDQVHSSGPWDDPPLEWSTMLVSSRGPVDVGPGDATHLSSTPAPEPPQKRARSSDAARRHGLIWDHTVFHVVASCRARPAIVAPSKRNCRIAQRIARTMSTTESHSEGLSNQVARRLGPERTSALHGASPGRL